jgi:hypothetical protein
MGFTSTPFKEFPLRLRRTVNPVPSQRPTDGEDERLFAWAIALPVLTEHYSITAPTAHGVAACACTPNTQRTIGEWARHVSDEIARTIS